MTKQENIPIPGSNNRFHLRKKGDQLLFRFEGEQDESPVRVVRLRPLSAPESELAIVDMESRHELALITDRNALDQQERELIEEELGIRYFLPRITSIRHIEVNLGNYYWDVDTDKGHKNFLLTNPGANIHWLASGHCLINDSFGNHYEIGDIEALDATSRKILGQVL